MWSRFFLHGLRSRSSYGFLLLVLLLLVVDSGGCADCSSAQGGTFDTTGDATVVVIRSNAGRASGVRASDFNTTGIGAGWAGRRVGGIAYTSCGWNVVAIAASSKLACGEGAEEGQQSEKRETTNDATNDLASIAATAVPRCRHGSSGGHASGDRG
jgi:hypothetical protein